MSGLRQQDKATGMPQGNHLRVDSQAKPTQPRIVQILEQVPISQERRKSEDQARQAQHDQQAKNGHRHTPEGMMLDVPIHTLVPLRDLNAYRASLGLGPSKNLISSAIYKYDPEVVAEYFNSHPSQWDKFGAVPFAATRPPLQESTYGKRNNESSSYLSGNARPSTSSDSSGSSPSTTTPDSQPKYYK